MKTGNSSYFKRKAPEALDKALEKMAKIVENSAQTNRNLFIAFNFVLITALVLCLGVTDEDLLLGSSSIKLPLLNITLPVWAFASIAPMVLVALHFDLLHNLGEHRDKLMAWRDAWFKVYPDQTRNADMPRHTYPFMFDFSWLHANHTGLADMRSKLLPGLCWLLYCWAAYTVLVIFFIRFADLQHYGYTSWHLSLLFLDAMVLRWYWPGFTQKSKPAIWKSLIGIIIAPLWFAPYVGRKVLDKLNLNRRVPLLMLWLSNVAALWTLALFIFIQAHIDFGATPAFVWQALVWEQTSHNLLGLHLVPRLSLAGFRLTLPEKFFEVAALQSPSEKNNRQLWQETNNALDLSGRRLAFADFNRALLPHSNLRRAKLQGADLRSAQLQGAYLGSAQLQGADLESAQLQGAVLIHAQLQGAVLIHAQLQGALLKFAGLQGADLMLAQLQGAYLESAQLQGASLDSAQLQGAYLGFARLQGALLIKTRLKGVKLSGSEQLETSWAEQLNWQQDYDFTGIMSESWAQPKYIQQPLKEAQQRAKDFKPPQLSQPISKETFAPIWLGLLCKDADATKGMLKQFDTWHITHPVTKAQARQYLADYQECAPYRDILAE